MISKVENIDCMIGMARYPDKYFELAIVDPPYGIGASDYKRGGTQHGNSVARCKVYDKKNWDNKIPNDEYFGELFRISKNQIIWGVNYLPYYFGSGVIVWDKDNSENNYSDCELAYQSFTNSVRKVKIRWHGMLQYDMLHKEERIHPTQKPIKLYKWCLKQFAKENDKILDTHLGSGSSRIAAYDMGFDFTGFELDKDYFLAQEKRFKEQTAQLKLAV